MEILGFDPVIVTIVICVIGVSYRILTGMAGKSWKEFNLTLAMTTFMLGIVTSVGLVAPVIDALPNDIDSTLQLAAVFGQIGLCSSKKRTENISKNKREKISRPF